MSRRLPPAASSSASNRHAGAGRVRIIGGRWRNTRLDVADSPGLRPTGERVRETLFNWLMPVLPGARVLDLFAGSGALGLEAVSRGAASAVLIERDPKLAAGLQALVQRLDASAQVEVRNGDALAWLGQTSQPQFDIAFVDPPFAGDLWPAVVLALPKVMNDNAWLYLESPRQRGFEPDAQWLPHRDGASGEVRHALYRRAAVTLRHESNPSTDA